MTKPTTIILDGQTLERVAYRRRATPKKSLECDDAYSMAREVYNFLLWRSIWCKVGLEK